MPLTHPLVVPGIRLRGGDVLGESELALARAREPWVAGFCLFGGEEGVVRDLLARLREAAGRPIFVASDMEHGAGQQVAGLRVVPEAEVWGLGGTPRDVELFGALTARDARSVGVDVLFAPVVDVVSERRNPIVGHRSYGWDPSRVALLASAFVRGALAGGALPVMKHFPGHGATTSDSHHARPVVHEDAERVLDRDLAPFLAVLEHTDCPAAMTAHVAYPALDDEAAIATFSRPIVDRLRRAPGGEGVVVFTDALCMEGAREGIGEAEAARRALRAGCDLLLCPDDVDGVAAGLGELPAGDLEAAAARVRAFLARPERTRACAAGDERAEAEVVERVAQRAVDLAWEGTGRPAAVLVVDDDGVPGRGRHLAERGAELGVEVRVVPPGEDVGADAPLDPAPVVVVIASVRAYKGGDGLGEHGLATLERLRERAAAAGQSLRVVWCGVRGPLGEVHVPGTAPQVERAVARALLPSQA